jgi:hypothetical protein
MTRERRREPSVRACSLWSRVIAVLVVWRNAEAQQMTGPFTFGSRRVDVLRDSYAVGLHAVRPA